MLQTTATSFQAALVTQQVKAELVLELGCGPRPTNIYGAQVHLCCENRIDSLTALQNATLREHNKFVIFNAAPMQALAMFPDNAVDLILISDLDAAASGTPLDQFLCECKRVAAHQIVLKTELPDGNASIEAKAHFDSPELAALDWNLLWAEPDHNETESAGVETSKRRNAWFMWTKPQPTKSRMPFKTAIVSIVFPPQDSGQATILGRILRGIDPDDYCLISSHDYSEQLFPRNLLKQPGISKLGARFYHLTPEIKWTRRIKLLPRALRHVISIGLQIRHRSKVIARIVQAEQCEAIIGCSGELIEFAAAYFASRRARVRFYAYLFDEYRYQSVLRFHRVIASWIERFALQNADAVIVACEFLRDEYRERYGVEAYVVRNPVEDLEPQPAMLETGLESEDEVSLLYTGQIYAAHYDAFQRLVEALEQLHDLNARLHIYTAQPPELLQAAGIRGPVVFHNFQPAARIRYLQQKADILFLPLAFNSPYPEIIRTSAPTKLGEYLISERPILAHVPKGSFISWYLREHQCGIVVDEPNPDLLAQAIRQLATDHNLRQQLARNASQQGKAFSVDKSRSDFLEILSRSRR